MNTRQTSSTSPGHNRDGCVRVGQMEQVQTSKAFRESDDAAAVCSTGKTSHVTAVARTNIQPKRTASRDQSSNEMGILGVAAKISSRRAARSFGAAVQKLGKGWQAQNDDVKKRGQQKQATSHCG